MSNHITSNGQGKRPVMRQDGKCIGYELDRIFYKPVQASIHLLRKPPAYACDVLTLQEVTADGSTAVVLLERESGCRYQASIEDFNVYGFTINRGFGDQVALPLARWSVIYPDKPTPTRQLGFNFLGGLG